MAPKPNKDMIARMTPTMMHVVASVVQLMVTLPASSSASLSVLAEFAICHRDPNKMSINDTKIKTKLIRSKMNLANEPAQDPEAIAMRVGCGVDDARKESNKKACATKLKFVENKRKDKLRAKQVKVN